MADLSPAAQAVLDAYDDSPFDEDCGDRVAIAAALRAAADQVVPEQTLEDVPGRFVNGCCHARLQDTRAELLAIAAELEQPEPEFTAEEVEMIQAPWSYLSPSQPTSEGD